MLQVSSDSLPTQIESEMMSSTVSLAGLSPDEENVTSPTLYPQSTISKSTSYNVHKINSTLSIIPTNQLHIPTSHDTTSHLNPPVLPRIIRFSYYPVPPNNLILNLSSPHSASPPLGQAPTSEPAEFKISHAPLAERYIAPTWWPTNQPTREVSAMITPRTSTPNIKAVRRHHTTQMLLERAQHNKIPTRVTHHSESSLECKINKIISPPRLTRHNTA